MISFRRGAGDERAVWVDVPFTGMLNVFWQDGTRGRTFFDTDHGEDGERAWWAGPVHVQFSPDTTRRPSTGAFMLLLAALGWTEGHLWKAPEALGGWGVVVAFAVALAATLWVGRRYGRDDGQAML